jgi:hypothetical protein
VFTLVSAILHLGNIKFRSTGDRACTIDNTQSLKHAARLLGVSADALQTCVTSRLMVIRGQAPTPISLSNKEAAESRDALAKFIYGEHVVGSVLPLHDLFVVYGCDEPTCVCVCLDPHAGRHDLIVLVSAANLFDWLVTRINKSIWGDAASAQGSMKCIGILDIFGFGMVAARSSCLLPLFFFFVLLHLGLCLSVSGTIERKPQNWVTGSID